MYAHSIYGIVFLPNKSPPSFRPQNPTDRPSFPSILENLKETKNLTDV